MGSGLRLGLSWRHSFPQSFLIRRERQVKIEFMDLLRRLPSFSSRQPRCLTVGRHWSRTLILGLGLSLALGLGCNTAYKKSVGGDTEQIFSRIFLTDYNTAWGSVLEALKSSPLEVSNRDSGFIRTKWVDNTSDRNLFESFGQGRAFLKAQYRFRVSVGKGFFEGEQSVKVAVQREQLVQSDVLEGWRPVISDSIEENTLLYRIGRIIFIRTKINKMEEEKREREIQESGLGGVGQPTTEPRKEDLEINIGTPVQGDAPPGGAASPN